MHSFPQGTTSQLLTGQPYHLLDIIILASFCGHVALNVFKMEPLTVRASGVLPRLSKGRAVQI